MGSACLLGICSLPYALSFIILFHTLFIIYTIANTFYLHYKSVTGNEGIATLKGAHGVSSLWPSPPAIPHDLPCDLFTIDI